LIQKVDRSKETIISSSVKKLGTLITRLQEGIMRTRLQELNVVFQRLPRVVRDLSSSTGKKISLKVEGGEVELDKLLIEAISEALIHMIRNGVDHGLESSEDRKLAGKDESGQIRVQAKLHGGSVILSVSDDGRGLDHEKIKMIALSRGLISQEQAQTLSREDLYELIFLPGFSTASAVTSTSGRGVGMDAVRVIIRKMGGTLDIATEPGHGTTFTASIPQTLTVTTCLLIRSGAERYALPQQNIAELLAVDTAALRNVEGHLVYNLRDRLLPVISLSGIIGRDEANARTQRFLAVIRGEKHRFGILLEEIINPEEIVVRPLGELFSGLELFSGAAIMGDGEAVLIIDAPGLARFAGLQTNVSDDTSAKSENATSTDENHEYVLFVISGRTFAARIDDVPRIVKVKLSDVERFLDVETFHFQGRVIPIVRVERLYNLPIDDSVELFIIVFGDREKPIAVASSRILAIRRIPALKTGAVSGPGVMGHAIMDGKTVIAINPRELVSKIDATATGE